MVWYGRWMGAVVAVKVFKRHAYADACQRTPEAHLREHARLRLDVLCARTRLSGSVYVQIDGARASIMMRRDTERVSPPESCTRVSHPR